PHISRAQDRRLGRRLRSNAMSALVQKQACAAQKVMSALGQKRTLPIQVYRLPAQTNRAVLRCRAAVLFANLLRIQTWLTARQANQRYFRPGGGGRQIHRIAGTRPSSWSRNSSSHRLR